jgi:hypothetical protein
MASRIQFWVVAGFVLLLLPGCSTSGEGEYQPCAPQCKERECGDDGCGGNCGNCAGESSCNAAGSCQAAADIRGTTDHVAAEFEILVPDGSPEKICQSLYVQFQSALAGDSSCENVLDCRNAVAAGDPCHCSLYVADNSLPDFLAALEAEYINQGCAANEKCDPCPWIEIPVCNHGICAPSQPSCEEVVGQFTQALLLAQQCSADEDCSGRAPGALDCDCEVPVNIAAWTDYFDLAIELWTTSECGVQLDCSCAVPSEVACIDGVCGTVE